MKNNRNYPEKILRGILSNSNTYAFKYTILERLTLTIPKKTGIYMQWSYNYSMSTSLVCFIIIITPRGDNESIFDSIIKSLL